MEPFKIRIDWTAAKHYPGSPVEVELLRMGAEPKTLRTFAVADTDFNPALQAAAAWAVQWFEGRGLGYWHQASWHRAEGHTHVTLHCTGRA